MMKYSGGHQLQRRNSCTSLRSRPPSRGEGDFMAPTPSRFTRIRRLSIKEHSHTESAPLSPPPAPPPPITPQVIETPSGSAVGVCPTTQCLGSDPSLRVSTILRRWNSHRERRFSDSRAYDNHHYDNQPPVRKLSSW
ncbi:uncharacterized protein [Macrobrachium rosenbergii]|uniref:uncharacterized protein n=1 Tax=Macrobrachium rosenbergii TaxID=79674 RepID=UPI0034D7929C